MPFERREVLVERMSPAEARSCVSGERFAVGMQVTGIRKYDWVSMVYFAGYQTGSSFGTVGAAGGRLDLL